MAPSQPVDVPARPLRRVPIAARFWLVLGVLVAAMLVMGGLGFDGLARMADSGEEFLLLFPDTDLEGAAIAAETIRAAVAKVTLPTVDREITASIGLASMPDDGLDGETLVRAADRCLYVAKSNGRNRVETPQGKPDAAVA